MLDARYDWRVDGPPVQQGFAELGDVPRGIEVGVEAEPTLFTLEYASASVPSFDVSAYDRQQNLNILLRYITHSDAMEETEKAYLAGFIDGEGCIYAQKIKTRNSFTIRGNVYLGNTSEEIIRKINKIIKNGRQIVTRHSQKPHWKPMFRIELSQKQGANLLQKILPYLFLKKSQAELFIELGELKKKSKRGIRYNEERQNQIMSQIKALNKRGV